MTNAYKLVPGTAPRAPKTQGIETLTTFNVEDAGLLGMRPLHLALRVGNLADLEKILTLGANPFAKSGPGGSFPQDDNQPPERFIEIFRNMSQELDKYERAEALKVRLKAAQAEANEILLVNLHLCCRTILRSPADQIPDPEMARVFIDAANQSAERFSRFPDSRISGLWSSATGISDGLSRLVGTLPDFGGPVTTEHMGYGRGLPSYDDSYRQAMEAKRTFDSHFVGRLVA